MNERLVSFCGGASGGWRVLRLSAVVGEGLPEVGFLEMKSGAANHGDAVWVLQGVTSNERYVTREEKQKLVAKQEGLGRPSSTRAALIPIRKSPEWWAMTQEERREIFEAQSQHTSIGLRFLPGIARRLHHCRDLSSQESFDFLTWFEYAPEESSAFEDLVAQLRATPEWRYVIREVDLRLERSS